MKKILLFMGIFLFFANITNAYNNVLFMATTTSTADTGLLDYLTPIFQEDCGYTLKFVSVGSGEALAMGRNGDVDIILTHAKKQEEEFVQEGYSLIRYPIMYNDFILVGPKLPLKHSEDISKTFLKIMELNLPFLSRGDKSGTHYRELEIWKELGLDPSDNPNYQEVGQGMGATLSMAEETKSYTLTDRGTWQRIFHDSEIKTENIIICENDSNLYNQYAVLAINPNKYEHVNYQAAKLFIEWIRSEKVQNLIKEYGKDKYGKMFIPNANPQK